MRTLLTMATASAIALTGSLSAQENVNEEGLVRKGAVARPAVNEEMAKALNSQLKLEMESAYLYLGMSTYFAVENLDGFAHWFDIHVQEELEHALKLRQFMLDRGIPVAFSELSAPQTSWKSPIEALETALAHEIIVSQAVKDEYGLAQQLKEYDVGEFLLWYLREQVEEENLFEAVLDRLLMIQGGHPEGMLLLDIEMGKR